MGTNIFLYLRHLINMKKRELLAKKSMWTEYYKKNTKTMCMMVIGAHLSSYYMTKMEN